MANYNKIYDPISKTYIDNSIEGGDDKTKKVDPFSIDPFSGKPLNFNKPKSTVFDASDQYSQHINSKDYDTFPINNIESANLYDDRARMQSAGEQLTNGIVKAGVTFGGALVDNTIGAYVGILSALATGDLNSIYDNPLGRTIDDVNSWAQENYPSYYTEAQQETINPLTMNFWADKVLNGFAYSAASMTSAILPGIGISKGLGNLARNEIKAATNETAKNLFKATKGDLVNALQVTKRSAFSAFAESGVEARETKNQMQGDLIKNRKEQIALDNGAIRDANGQIDISDIHLEQGDLDDIENYTSAAGNANFGVNIVVVGGSNFIIFPKLLRGSGDDIYEGIRKGITKDAKGVFKAAEKSKLNTLKEVGKDMLSEASEEGSQYASNIAFNDYYTNKFEGKGNEDLSKSVTDGIAATFGSNEGLESMLIGAIVGGGMTGLKHIKSNKNADAQINRVVNILNTDNFKDLAKRYRNYERTMSYHKDMSDAVVKGDKEAFKRSYHNMFMSAVYDEAQQGTAGVLIDKLEQAKNMDQEEFKKFFGMEDVEGEVDPSKMANEAIENVKKGIEIYKNLDFLFNDKEKSIASMAAKVFGKKEATDEDKEITKQVLTDLAFQQLSDFDYLKDRETSLAQEVAKNSEGLITYLDNANKEGGNYFQTSTEQLEKVKDKVFEDAYYKNKELQKTIRDAIKRSEQSGGNTKFKSTKDFRDRMFQKNSDLTEKQKGIINALEQVKQSSWLRADKKLKLTKDLEALQNLAFERALGNEAYNRLADISKPSVNEALANRVNKTIEELIKQRKANIESKAEEAKTSKEQKTSKTEAKVNDSEDPKQDKDDLGDVDFDETQARENEIPNEDKPKKGKTETKVDNIIAKKTNEDKQNAPNFNKEEDIATQLLNRFTANPRLKTKEIPDINDIIKENGNETPLYNELGELEFYTGLQKLEQKDKNNKTIQAIRAYYDAIDNGKSKEAIPQFNQPVPNVEKEVDSNDSEDPKLNELKKNAKDNLPEDQAFLVTPTKEFRTKGYPEIFDENISKINNPEFAEKGTKVYLEIMDTEYSRDNPSRPQVLVFVRDENGNKIPIGLWGGNKSSLSNEIMKEVTSKYKIGDTDIDLDLQIETKWAGNINSTKELKSLSEIENNGNKPILAVAIEKEGELLLHTNLVNAPEVIYNKLRSGHTYMLIPTAKKNKNGDTIYYPAHVTTSKVGSLEESVKKRIINSVTKLLLSATKDPKTKNITNYEKINDEIFLNFDLQGDNINIYSPQGEGNEPLKLSFNKNSKEDLQKLNDFLNNAVVRIDYRKINVGSYNARLDTDGKTKTDLDALTPIYNTAFIVSKTKKSPDINSESLNKEDLKDKNLNPTTRENTGTSEINNPKEPVSLPKGFSSNTSTIFGDENESKGNTIETQEADIERRRQEENNIINKDNILNDLGLDNLTSVKTPVVFSSEEGLIDTEHGKAQGVRTKYSEGVLKGTSRITLNQEATLEVLVHEVLHDFFNSRHNTPKNENFAKSIFNTLSKVAKTDSWFKRVTETYGKESYKESSEELAILYLTSKEFRDNLPISIKNRIEKWLLEESIVTQAELDNYLSKDLTVKIKDKINAKYDAELDTLKGTPKARKQTVKFKKSDNESELAYLKRVLPSINVKVLESLESVAKQGKNAWGLFLDGAIYLKNNFSKGTAFHEGFHAVFNGMLTDEERSNLLIDAQARYGTHSIEEQDELKSMYPNLNDSQIEDIWLEEQMAEDFRRYVENLQDKSLSNRLRNFFKKLWDLITFSTTTDYIDTVFENIDKGVYGKEPINHRFRAEPLFRQKRIPGLNTYRETKDVINVVNTLFENIVSEHADKNNITELQAIADLTPEIIYYEVYNVFHNTYEQAKRNNNKPLENKMANIMNAFLVENDDKSLSLDLVPQLHMDSYRRNEKINLKTLQEQSDFLDGIDINDVSEDELPSWQQASIEKNGRDKLSLAYKRLIRNLKSTTLNTLGVADNVPAESTYNVLSSNLNGIFNSKTFFQKLDNLAILYPELTQLTEKLNNDSSLKAGFYHNFAKGKNEYASVITEKVKLGKNDFKIKTSIVNLSKANQSKEILTNLESFMLASPLFDENKVNEKNAQQLYKLYKKQLSILRDKDSFTADDFSMLSTILGKYSIKISEDDLLKQSKSFGRKKFLSNLNDVQTKAGYIFKTLAEGKNPFSEDASFMNKAFDSLTELITSGKEQYLQDSIMNSENKMQYSYVDPNHIHKTIANLNNNPKQFAEFFASDPSYAHHLFLQQALEGTTEFNVIVGDGLQNKIEYKDSRYKGYTLKNFDSVNLAMYYNQGNNKAYYSFPELSDSPIQYFMQNRKFNMEEGLSELYNLFLFERDRIDTNVKIENYDKDTFTMFPFFNSVSSDQLLDEKFVKDEIRKYFVGAESEYFSNFLSKLEDNNIISKDENGVYQSEYMDSGITSTNKYNSIEDFLQEYYINNSVITGNIMTLFAGDPNFAKVDSEGNRVTDLNKRLKEIAAPMQVLDTNITGPTFNMFIVEDEKIDITKKALYEGAEKLAKKDNRLKILSKAVENTDGQTIISLQRYKKIKQAQHEWTPELEKMYPALLAGTETPSQTLFMAKTIKGFYFGLSKDTSGKVVPIQKKDSELVLLPSMAKGNPKLEDLLDRLNSKNKYKNTVPIEGVTFASTIKKGAKNIQKLDDDNKYLDDSKVVEFNYESFGIQQPSPQKHLDSKINFGTQFRKLITANLTGSYAISGIEGPVKANDVKNLMHDIMRANLEEDYTNLFNSISTNGELDLEKLRDVLLRELENGDYPIDHIDALELTQDGFKLDLWNPKHSHRIESLLNSLVKNKVTKQKINGATLINASDYVVKNDNSLELKMNEDNTAIEYMQAKLPWWSKDLFDLYADKDGIIDVNKLEKDNPELLEAVGYRIPTEDKYSMVKIKVVGFTNQSAGGNIFLPVEALTLTGMDFDIDKMFFILPNHKANYSKFTYKKAFEFLKNLNISRQDILEEYASFSDVVSANEEYLNSLSFRDLKRNFIEDILFSNTIENNHYKNAYLKEYGINEIESIEYIKPDYNNIKESSRKQRDNGLLEIAKSVLTAPQTFDEQSNPGNFKILSDIRNEYVEFNGLGTKSNNPILPDVQRELFLKSSDAGFLIGVFANNNSSHSMLQWENITLSDTFETMGYNISELDRPNDKKTARSLGTLVAASVDAIKDPVFHELNITKFTGDVLSTMLRTGVSLRDALSLLNNKVIINASKQISNLGFADPTEVTNIINNLKTNKTNVELASKEDINIRNSKSNTENDRLLNTFKEFYDLSLDLRKLTKATKVDANPPGSTMADNEVFMRAVSEAAGGTLTKFNGVGDIFTDASNYSMIKDFYLSTYQKPTEEMFNKLLPWNNKNFRDVKNQIESYFTTSLSASQIRHINNSLMTYIISNNDFFKTDSKKLGYLNGDEFFNKVIKLKKEKDDNIFLKLLNVNKDAKTISFKNTTSISTDKIEELQAYWQDLLDESDETREIAEDLFRFNFISHGFIFGPKSFYHIAPLTLFENSIDKNEVNLQLQHGNFLSTFVEQYVRQSSSFDKLNVPKIDPKGLNVEKTNIRNIIKAKEELGTYDVISKSYIYPDYLKEPFSKMLFRRIGNEFDNTYSPVPLLGTENRVEYAPNNIEPNTLYNENIIKLGDKDIRRGSQYLNQLEIQKSETFNNVESYNWYNREDDGFRIQESAKAPNIEVKKKPTVTETAEITQPSQQVKEGVNELFESNPELANIGTSEQYLQYLSTIFKTSKVKDIVYHGTTDEKFYVYDSEQGEYIFKLDKLNINTHFGTKQAAIDRIKTKRYNADDIEVEKANDLIIPVIINSNFKRIIDQEDSNISWNNEINKAKKEGYDSLIYSNIKEDKGNDSYVIFKPEQIHILSSKADIQGFKEFVSNENNSNIEQEVTETESSQLDMFEESKLEQEISKPYEQVKTNNNIAISKIISPEEWKSASEEEKKNILKCN